MLSRNTSSILLVICALSLLAWPNEARSDLLTDPDDPRTWQGASVETFRVLLGFPTKQALIDAQILDDGIFPTGLNLSDFASAPAAPCGPETASLSTGTYIGAVEGCSGHSFDPNSFAFTCGGATLGVYAARANCLDWWWVQDTGDDDLPTGTKWDLGGQANQVVVFPIIDHGPLPGEAIEYSVYLSNNPSATTSGTDGNTDWVLADLERVYLEGWHPDWIADGFTTVWRLPDAQTFRFVNVPAGGPGAIRRDGDHEIDAVLGLTFEGDPVGETEVSVDIKPGSCPNPVNPGSGGYIPISILGTADFDPLDIDFATVVLSRADGVGGDVAPNEGPPGPHSVFEDTATPFDGELCDCHDLEGDGFDDLSMKFKAQDVVDALELDDEIPGTVLELVVSGILLDGTPFVGSDCIVIVGGGP